MSSLTIYRFGETLARATIKPETSSQQQVTLMQEDVLVLNFQSPTVIAFQIGDYCTFMGKLYQINKLPQIKKIAKRNLQYSLQMEAEYYDLAKVSYLFLDANDNFTEPVFPLRGRLQDFADLIVYNLNRVFPTAGWVLGTIIVTDYQTIQFSAQNCLQVLNTIASAFNTEFFCEGKVINIFQRQNSSNIVLSVGQDEALLSLTQGDQTSANIITRLYAYGSTKNISATYRSGAQRLRMGDIPYLEKNVALYRLQEFTVLFDGTNGNQEIYPHRTGTVSAIGDPIENPTAWFLEFTDAAIDFDVNGYLIAGVTAQVTFNTGLLSGYTFDISTFNNTTKKFVINQNTSDPNFIAPSALYHAQIGDTYVITQINQPAIYYTNAEAELKAAAQAYLDKYNIPPLVYSGECNPLWFKRNNPNFKLTDSIQMLDIDLGINRITRITAFVRNFINIFEIQMTLSDTVTNNTIIIKLLNGL
jgi:hypothetical protein